MFVSKRSNCVSSFFKKLHNPEFRCRGGRERRECLYVRLFPTLLCSVVEMEGYVFKSVQRINKY
jgi:hypothetical protein